MEGNNGFSPNKCTARGTCRERQTRDKKRLKVRGVRGVARRKPDSTETRK